MLGNLLLYRLLQQVVLTTLMVRPIDARDSKIRPELRTYSKFEDELKAIRNPSHGGHRNPVDSVAQRNPVDSVGPMSVNKFLSKGSDSEEIEAIDEDDEQQPDSTPSSVELNKEALDSNHSNQTELTDSSNLSKLANETTNSTISMPINQTIAAGNHSDGHHLNETVHETTSNDIDGPPTSRTTSEMPLSALTTDHLSHTTEDTNRLSQTTEATSHFNQTKQSTVNEQTTETSSHPSQSTASDHQTTEATSNLEQTSLSGSHLNGTTTATSQLSETTTSGHLQQTTSNDHIGTEASHNQTSVKPLDQANSSNRTLDRNSTIEPRNNETTTIPNFASTVDLDLKLNLTARNNTLMNTPNDSSTAFPYKACYTLDELESMVSCCCHNVQIVFDR